jgi:hypothetical protein
MSTMARITRKSRELTSSAYGSVQAVAKRVIETASQTTWINRIATVIKRTLARIRVRVRMSEPSD